ncbi:MAG: PQQ-like beta-propeller repeat protein [Bryobacterales bacterium]|nr:PQQ-like beta-propeller repeat protein [Bryobacterales bacterium]
MIIRHSLAFVVGFCVLAAAAAPPAPDQFRRLGTYKGLGGLVATAVGPGPGGRSERFYASYLYLDHTIDVVGIDPENGSFQVFPNPAPTESGARCMVKGPDGNLYLGTLPKAHFLKLDPVAGKLIDLGRPSATEEYIWDAAFGTDKKLYGVTYPQAKLVRYDPASGKLEDLGRMDPVEQYARWVAASSDGFVYAGIGTSKANIAAYNIATGEHREILPPQFQAVGITQVYHAASGVAYATLNDRHFRMKGWTVQQIAAGDAEPPAPANVLANGKTVELKDHTITVTDPKTKQAVSHDYRYQGNLLNIFRIGFGPDQKLYGSSVLPIYLLRLEADGHVQELGALGGGEFYSFLRHGPWLLGAAYSAFSPLMKFDTARPFQLDKSPKNPLLVNFAGSDSAWRPQAMIEGPDGKAYVGAVSGYGKLGGGMAVWDTRTDSVEDLHNLVTDQSVVSLAAWKDRIIGGTTVGGGGGSRPTTTEARIYVWNPNTRQKEFETVPVPGATTVTDLITAKNGLVYGIAGRTLFVFDPAARRVVDRKPIPFGGFIYNAIANMGDGQLVGLSGEGIFRVDTATNNVELIARAPSHVTAGFAVRGSTIYFVSGAEIWSWAGTPLLQ